MTTLNIPQSRLGDPVHFVAADNPDANPDDPMTSKSCRHAEVTAASDDPRLLDLVVFHRERLDFTWGVPFDEVSLPKIEAGPSGRAIGTWHFVGMCG